MSLCSVSSCYLCCCEPCHPNLSCDGIYAISLLAGLCTWPVLQVSTARTDDKAHPQHVAGTAGSPHHPSPAGLWHELCACVSAPDVMADSSRSCIGHLSPESSSQCMLHACWHQAHSVHYACLLLKMRMHERHMSCGSLFALMHVASRCALHDHHALSAVTSCRISWGIKHANLYTPRVDA